jgi:pimeloyl-ACP methyl ester carboxylesterase
MMSRRPGFRSRASSAPDEIAPERTLAVRAADGTRLHTEIFGPPDGYPIVLAHGITCTTGAWRHQIADLAVSHRVIAYDQRGHGRSGIPRRQGYSLSHLAADLDAVLEATLAPREAALLVGHSMGGMAIMAWSDRYRHKVDQRADAVALLNTTNGDLLRGVDLLPVPRQFSAARVLAARQLVSTFGSFGTPAGFGRPTRTLVKMLAVGAQADPAVAALVYELFTATSPAGRGGCAKMLVTAVGHRHISLTGLTVPTLVIGSQRDRLTPLSQSRRIARTLPYCVGLVELPGGHCAMLEQPQRVNSELRSLAESVTGARRISS